MTTAAATALLIGLSIIYVAVMLLIIVEIFFKPSKAPANTTPRKTLLWSILWPLALIRYAAKQVYYNVIRKLIKNSWED